MTLTGNLQSQNLFPGVVLTFDDGSNLLPWSEQIPLFARYNAKVTFFVDNPDLLDAAQVAALRRLAAAGHEIGGHGFRHVRAVDAIRNGGVQEYIRSEIEPASAAFRRLGVNPASFAYPFSQRDRASDAALCHLFRRARTGAEVEEGVALVDSDIFFTPVAGVEDHFCLTGKNIDHLAPDVLMNSLLPALNRLKTQHEILVLYAHNVASRAASHVIHPHVLELLLRKLNALNLNIYRVSDLPSRFGPGHAPEPSAS